MLKKIKITKEEIKNLYLSGKTLEEIANIAGCNHSNIKTHLMRMNVPRRLPTETSRKYNLNESYFEKINNPYKAYILGLLFADGYNQESKNQIRLTLHCKDKDILDKIRLCLNYNKPLYRKEKFQHGQNRIFYDLSINSKKISMDLASLGCTQNKTFSLVYPSIENQYNSHFIRGYFDGDGCFSFSNYDQQWVFSITGTKNLLLDIQKILMIECSLNKTKLTKRKKNTEIYTLIYKGNKQLKRIVKYLYQDSFIYLNRKFELANSILTQ